MVSTEPVTSGGSGRRALVIIPTYNEADSIPELVPCVLAASGDVEMHVLVVDDASPDGTAALVTEMGRRDPRVHLLSRPAKLGLGTAYVAGFRYALEQGYDFIFEMDADFSHDPSAIPSFLDRIRDHDLVLGSRYVSGVTVVNWPLKRLILSYGANAYTRVVTGMPFRDATGGYKCFRREALAALDLGRIRSDGYSFQIEVSFLLWRRGFRIVEIPIVFADRRVGVSKMSRRIVWEAVWMVWRLRIQALLGRIP